MILQNNNCNDDDYYQNRFCIYKYLLVFSLELTYSLKKIAKEFSVTMD